jgi:hypothetical protein
MYDTCYAFRYDYSFWIILEKIIASGRSLKGSTCLKAVAFGCNIPTAFLCGGVFIIS